MELDVKRHSEQINNSQLEGSRQEPKAAADDDDDKDGDNVGTIAAVPAIGVRHVQSLLLFLCMVCHYLVRVSLSVTVVAMTPEANSTDYYRELALHVPTFGWPNATRSMLLGSFFVGYLVANLPASALGCVYDNKTLLAYSTAVSSLLAAASPWAAESFGSSALMAVRFAQGLSSAFMFPMVYGIMAKWAPPHERGRLLGLAVSGVQLGTVITLVVSGVLSSSPLGWPSVYYLTGVVGFAWTAMWLLLGAESPAAHRSVSTIEKDYIQRSLANTVATDIRFSDTPWRSIMTSLPVWALLVAHTGYNWGFWLLLTEMPTFMHTVLKFNIKNDGMLSALPYLAMFLLQVPVSYASDWLNARRLTTLTVSRKAWNTVSMWGAAAGLVALGYMRDTASIVTLYVFVVAIAGASNCGFHVNHLDLSPNYAGLLMGITNAAAASGGIIAPLYVGLVVDDQTSFVQWRTVFISGAVVLFVSNLIFIMFGSSKTQPWNSLTKGEPKVNKVDDTKQEVDKTSDKTIVV